MLTAYSAVASDNIPAAAEIVFAYANPPYAQLEEVRAHCPHARIVPIATHPEYMAEMYDFETGALEPAGAGDTIVQALERGINHPICYFSLSNHDVIVDSLQRSHVARKDVRLLPAHYTEAPELPDWADGVQWGGPPLHPDLNTYELRDDFFHWHLLAQPAARRKF
jgi:hypothetical protein